MTQRIKCYDTQDMYKRVLKKDRIVDEKTFSKIIKTYLRHAADAIFDYSEVILPHGCGQIRLFVYDNQAWYDTKTGYIHKPLAIKDYKNDGKLVFVKKLIKIKYYKLHARYNPFNMCKLYKSKYINKRIFKEIMNGSIESRFRNV